MPAEHFAQHFSEHQKVVDACIASLQPKSDAAAEAIISCLARGGKILAFGNGGSATQASHLVEELIGRFKETRRPLPAISLVADAGVITCILMIVCAFISEPIVGEAIGRQMALYSGFSGYSFMESLPMCFTPSVGSANS